jgi:hypothetical protein
VNKAVVEQDGTVKAICWMQGERDARYKVAADQYYENFCYLIDSFRHDLGDVPFIFGRISPPRDGRFPHMDTVREAQAKAVNHAPNISMVNTDDLDTSDTLHFSVEGVAELGRRFVSVLKQ